MEESLPDSASKHAAEGTLAHSVCELAARKHFTAMPQRTYNGKLKKLKDDPLWNDDMLTSAATYVEHLSENAMRFEHTPYVALEVKVDIGDYAPEAFGTCDCVMIGGDELIITDYKNGTGVPVDTEGNPQMLLYALGALKLYRPIFGETIRRVTVHIDQPRLNSYGSHTLTVDELLEWGESVKPKAAAAFAGIGECVTGDWCKNGFCRAKAQCRAYAAAHSALEDFKDAIPLACAGGIDPNLEPMPRLLTDAEIGDLLTRGKALVDWYNALEEYALGAILKGGTIPGHKVVEGTSKATFAPDFDTAANVLIAAGYSKATLYRETPETLTNLDKLVGGRAKLQEILGDHLYKPPGKPALVPESDKRPPYSGAAADFGGVVS
jgi:hypothetical protein